MRVLLFGMCLIVSVGVGPNAFGQQTLMSAEQELRLPFEHAHLEEMSVEQLEQELVDAELFKDLTRSKPEIEQRKDCGPLFRETQDTLDQLKSLNQRYRGRANATYQARAQDLKSRNAQALKSYKICFGDSMQLYDAIFASHLQTYDQHRAKFKALEPKFHSITTLGKYIEDIEAVIANKPAGPVVANVLSSFDEVLVSLDGKTGWQTVKRGEALRQGLYIKTGARGRARVQFHDHEPERGRGPTIVNIAPNSVVKLASFVMDPKTESRRGVLDLVKGAIRAFTKGWGERSRFSIRTGTSICGMRGTEVGIVYNPETGVADYHLDHGDAFAEVDGRETPLQPKTSVRVQNGQVSDPVPLSQQFWDNLVSMSGSGKPEDGQVDDAVALSQQFSDNLESISGSGEREDKGTDLAEKTLPSDMPQVFDRNSENQSKQPRDFRDWLSAGWPDDGIGKWDDPLTGPKGARKLVKTALYMLYTNDLEGMKLFSSQYLLGEIVAETRDRTLKAYLDETGKRPQRHQYRCTQCTSKVKQCAVLVDVWYERHHNNKKTPVMFVVEEIDERRSSAIVMNEADQRSIDYIIKNSRDQCR